MTNEEAINVLKSDRDYLYTNNRGNDDKPCYNEEAYDLAIKALEERPKGKWIGDTDYESCQGMYEGYKCSVCGYGIDWRKHLQLMCQDEIPEEYREYCCPHCGADMRGDV